MHHPSKARVLQEGTTVEYQKRTFAFDGERPNSKPDKCWTCRVFNGGDHVYVLVETPQPGNPHTKKLWCCRACIVAFFGEFDSVASTDESNEVAF